MYNWYAIIDSRHNISIHRNDDKLKTGNALMRNQVYRNQPCSMCVFSVFIDTYILMASLFMQLTPIQEKLRAFTELSRASN